MRILPLLLACLFITVVLTSETKNQNGWSFYLNKKSLITSSTEYKNLSLKTSSFTETDTFRLSYFFCGSGTEFGTVSEVEFQDMSGRTLITFREVAKEYSVFHEVHIPAKELTKFVNGKMKVFFRTKHLEFTSGNFYLFDIQLK